MAVETSAMMPLGAKAPDFSLLSVADGRRLSLGDLRGENGTMVMFICNHCPFVVHLQRGLVAFANDYKDKIGIIAICSNDAANYPDDSPESMKRVAEREGYPFPYLHDETQETARAYGATCTPDFFLFDGDLKCAYRGRFDSSRPGAGAPVSGSDLRRAVDLLLAGGRMSEAEQKPSAGCGIKWKA